MRTDMVPFPQQHHALPLDLIHTFDFRVHMHSRFRLFHFTERSGFNDIGSFTCKAQLGDNIIPLRRHHLQGKKRQGQTRGPGPHPAGYGVHLDGKSKIMGNSEERNYICENFDINIWKLEQRRPWASIF